METFTKKEFWIFWRSISLFRWNNKHTKCRVFTSEEKKERFVEAWIPVEKR